MRWRAARVTIRRAKSEPVFRKDCAARGALSLYLYLDREHVALAAHRLDDLRVGRVVAQAVAQPADLDVDAAIQRVGVVALGEKHELVAREHVVRMAEKNPQQLVFRSEEHTSEL